MRTGFHLGALQRVKIRGCISKIYPLVTTLLIFIVYSRMIHSFSVYSHTFARTRSSCLEIHMHQRSKIWRFWKLGGDSIKSQQKQFKCFKQRKKWLLAKVGPPVYCGLLSYPIRLFPDCHHQRDHRLHHYCYTLELSLQILAMLLKRWL